MNHPLPESASPSYRRLARLVLSVFVLMFIVSRVTVMLIMSRAIPDFFLHLGGTHVHHLNYGIFLLSGTGAYLLFAPPETLRRRVAAILYAIGLALTFDEFGMWLHLGGGYWQQASFDAVVVLAGLLALLAYAPSPSQLSRRHIAIGGALLFATVLFYGMLANTVKRGESKIENDFQQLERESPP